MEAGEQELPVAVGLPEVTAGLPELRLLPGWPLGSRGGVQGHLYQCEACRET